MTGLLRLLVFLLLIFAAVWAGVRVANASGDSQAFEGARYEVRARDTLWSIAAAHYDCDADLRELVYDIQRRNDLSDGLLLPGQEILLPFNDHGPLAQTP